MLLAATFIFTYYTLWTFATPFLSEDNIIQSLFPPRYYAIALPVIALILGVCLVATFIGSVILKSASKKKGKKN